MNKETEEMRADVRNALAFALKDEKLQYIPDFDKPITKYLKKHGYGKVENCKKQSVWHKVAEGDLPETCVYVIVVHNYGRSIGLLTDNNTWELLENPHYEYPIDKVIAWTELPKYEE